MKSFGTIFLSLTLSIISYAADENELEGFKGNIDKLTVNNTNYRQVIYTGNHIQLVLMSLKKGKDIGEEVHPKRDQFFRVESGSGDFIINGKKKGIKEDDAFIVPAGAKHNIINSGKSALKLYTLYAPPEHKDRTIHKKKDASASEEHFDGKTTE